MRKVSLIALMIIIIGAVNVFASEPSTKTEASDSTKVNVLEEVVVEGDEQYVTPTKSVYTPTDKMKNRSSSADDLLMHMAIPEIRVSPVDGIKTLSGADVSVFINYMPLSSYDSQMMNLADVIRVEYLDFPNDPRFMGAAHVVNFIMKEYEYGGYTKLYNSISNIDKVKESGNLFNRLNYKKLTADLFVGYGFNDLENKGSSQTDIYRFPQSDGSVKEIERHQKFLDSKEISTKIPLSLRLTYKGDKVTIRNSFGYTFYTTPTNYSRGELTMSNSPLVSSYENSSANHTNTLAWNGDMFLFLPNNWLLFLYDDFLYSHNNFYSGYKSGIDNLSVTNNSRESAYRNKLYGYIQKTIGGRHYIGLDLTYTIAYNRVEYMGDNALIQHYNEPNFLGVLSYNFNGSSTYLGLRAGMSWNGHKVNDFKVYRVSPNAWLNFSQTLNSKNRITVSAQYAMNSTTPSVMAPITLRTNEYRYTMGNPDAKQYNMFSASVNYTCLPNNMFNFSLYAEYFGFYNRLMEVYRLMPDREAIVSQYVNSGNHLVYSFGGSLSFKLEDKLTLSVTPSLVYYHLTGEYRHNYAPFQLESNGTYYFGDFSAGYYINLNRVSIDLMNDYYQKAVDYHQFSLSWGKNGLNVMLTICNPFRSSNKLMMSKIDTPVYAQNSMIYSPQYSRCYVLNLTYTFGYGKKIAKDNELKELKGGSSAVLK